MTTLPKTNKWINLALPQLDDRHKFHPQHIVSINAHEFIVYAGCGQTWPYKRKLFKYNIDTNEMNEWIHSTEIDEWMCTGKFYGMALFFNNKEQILCMQNNTNDQIISINMKTNNSHIYSDGISFGNYFLFINNCFHMINMHDCHWIGAIQNKLLNTLHNTIDDENYHRLNSGKAIYIPSKQCILLIGGDYNDNGPLSNEIWIYKLTNSKWIQINNVAFERYDFGAVLTSNERYIVLLGGTKYNTDTTEDDDTNDIFVLDMKDDNNWKMKKCKIKCPYNGQFVATRTGGIDSKNEILVIGFVRECFKLKEFKDLQLPPTYIVKLINKWYSGEMIHLMKHGQCNDHYGVYLKDILSSLY